MKKWSRHARHLEQEVNRLGEQLRITPYSALATQNQRGSEFLIDGRQATTAVLVERVGIELRVVVLGSVRAALLGRHVEVYGFYKAPNESSRDMPDDEYSAYD